MAGVSVSSMARLQAATWVAPADEVDRGNLLGAASVACARQDRDLGVVIEGAGRRREAIEAAQRTGMLILPATAPVIPVIAHTAALLQQAREEDWRLVLLDVGSDSATASGDVMIRFLARLSATGGPDIRAAVPPAALRERVGGALVDETLLRMGLLHVECYEAALATAGIELAKAGSVLDWGAGAGRMTTHLVARAPRAQITAVDTDAEAIAWVGDALPVTAAAIELMPPTALPDDAYDVVVGHSVFTHLGVESQDRWLAELARIARPGGHVVVSVNGPVALAWHLEHPREDVPASVAADCHRDGIAIWRGDGWEATFYDDYHTTFHEHAYVREHWSQWFDVLSIQERGALPNQDIVVLRAR